jgi:hypothetical protein
MAIPDQTGPTSDTAERTLRVVHEEVLDEAQLEAIAGGNKNQQPSAGHISVISEGVRSGIRVIGFSLNTEPNTL